MKIYFYRDKTTKECNLIYNGKKEDFAHLEALQEYEPFEFEIDGQIKRIRAFEYIVPIPANPNAINQIEYKVTLAK